MASAPLRAELTHAEHNQAQAQRAAESGGEQEEVDVGIERRRGEAERQHEQDADDDAADEVKPARVHPRPENVTVVAEEDEEHRRARKETAGPSLHSHG